MAGTAYTKRYAGGFIDGAGGGTPVDSQMLNLVEQVLLELIGTAPSVDKGVMSWSNASTQFGAALLLNANVDPNAAIASSKIDFTGGNAIVNAQIAAAAAIAYSKLNLAGSIQNSDIAAAAAIAISKLADPGSGKVIGSIGSGAIAVNPPGFELNYTQITVAPGAPSGVGSGNAVTAIAPGALTFDGGPYMFHFFAPACSAGAGNSIVIELHDGTNFMGIIAQSQQGSNPINGIYRFTPSAGSHTYTAKLYNLGASGLNIACGAGGTGGTYVPAFLRITKV